MSSISNVIEPMSFDEANEHDEWWNAMEEEYESIGWNHEDGLHFCLFYEEKNCIFTSYSTSDIQKYFFI